MKKIICSYKAYKFFKTTIMKTGKEFNLKTIWLYAVICTFSLLFFVPISGTRSA